MEIKTLPYTIHYSSEYNSKNLLYNLYILKYFLSLEIMQNKTIIVRLNLGNLNHNRVKPNQCVAEPKTKVPGPKAGRLIKCRG